MAQYARGIRPRLTVDRSPMQLRALDHRWFLWGVSHLRPTRGCGSWVVATPLMTCAGFVVVLYALLLRALIGGLLPTAKASGG